MPEAVSTCGAKTTAGHSAAMSATASSTGTGWNGAWRPLSPDSGSIGRAFSTKDSAGIFPASRICVQRSEEHTSELQSLMRISYAVFCLTKKKTHVHQPPLHIHYDSVRFHKTQTPQL